MSLNLNCNWRLPDLSVTGFAQLFDPFSQWVFFFFIMNQKIKQKQSQVFKECEGFFPKMGMGSWCSLLPCHSGEPCPWGRDLGMEEAQGSVPGHTAVPAVLCRQALTLLGQERHLWSTGTILGHPLSYSLSKQTVLHPDNLCVSLGPTFCQERCWGRGTLWHTEGLPKDLWAVDMELMSLYS